MTSTENANSRKRVKFDAPPTTDEEGEDDAPNTKPVPAPVSKGLQHLSYGCPGLTGAGSRMLVEPRTYQRVLQSGPIIIPLFQRAYCWLEAQLRKWWRDATSGGKNALVKHHTGKAVFKQHEGELLCIDGQQRCTTQLLLLTAVRDAALSYLSHPDAKAAEEARELVEEIEALLFPDAAAMRTWAQQWAQQAATKVKEGSAVLEEQWEEVLEVGARLPFPGGARLLPSFVDRRPFFELLLLGRCQHALLLLSRARKHQEEEKGRMIVEEERGESTMLTSGGGGGERKQEEEEEEEEEGVRLSASSHARESRQELAYRIFSQEARALALKSKGVAAAVTELRSAVTNSLQSIQMMYCEVLNEVNLSQVFLWLQEKTLFGQGALLFNAAPGISFRVADLARNLLLSSSVMQAQSMSEQERIFRAEWLEPVEKYANGQPERLDEMVCAFVNALDEEEEEAAAKEEEKEEARRRTGGGLPRGGGGGGGGGRERGRGRGRGRKRRTGSLEERLAEVMGMLSPNEKAVFYKHAAKVAGPTCYARRYGVLRPSYAADTARCPGWRVLRR